MMQNWESKQLSECHPEKMRCKVIGVEMKGVKSNMKIVALGTTECKGLAIIAEGESVPLNREVSAQKDVSKGIYGYGQYSSNV